ncbi:CopL family metal-binding regulatory protein [Xanthomonas euvesicatoria pv. allii]|uniref:CopL family metal-binding regulatory protein n=1 Tax=Xanthomonas euvesicatoria TaxID=456327 RepID=UPI0031C4F08A|nr:CopL family metal-binding regulatory protein [Xanthomonas euvesicatoria pv. allii]
MSFPAILLRVLLSLALILNGMGSAVAAVAMPMASGQGAAEHATQALASASDRSACHGHHGAAASTDAPPAKHLAPSDDTGRHPAPDCCKSSMCRCTGVHACASLLAASIQTPMILPPDPGMAPLAQGRPSPALPHLIRPPIG